MEPEVTLKVWQVVSFILGLYVLSFIFLALANRVLEDKKSDNSAS